MTDVIVIGGGAMGSATAWQLARRGAEVTLLEQFGPRHDNGASHGSSRIFRLAYPDLTHVRLALRAQALWRQLEQESGRTILTVTGGIDHGPEAPVLAVHAALVEAGAAAELLTPEAAAERWPGLRFEDHVLYHPAGGRLHADDAVAAFQEAAVTFGADVRHGTRVADISTGPGKVSVTTTGGEQLQADRVVVATGAWTPVLQEVLSGHLRTTQEQPAHFAVRDPGTPWPSFIHHPGAELSAEGSTGGGVYGLNSVDGVKVGFHGQGPEVDPDNRDRTPDRQVLGELQAYAERWLPGVDPGTATPMTCLYTLTPDQRFIVDRRGPITVLAGFSGHGFKFASAIGELAAGLTLDDTAPLEAFALGRLAGTPVQRAGFSWRG